MSCTASVNVISSPDYGDSAHPEVLWIRGAGEQHHVLPLRHRGDRRLPVCALAEPPRGRAGRAGHWLGNL